MPKNLARTGRTLLIALSSVSVCFISAATFSECSEANIRDDARSIATNVTPSIYTLSEVRQELRQLETLISAWVEQLPRKGESPAAWREIETSFRQVQDLWIQYKAEPFSPDEDLAWPAIDLDLTRLTTSLAKLRGAAPESGMNRQRSYRGGVPDHSAEPRQRVARADPLQR